jgi:hypothetical protein
MNRHLSSRNQKNEDVYEIERQYLDKIWVKILVWGSESEYKKSFGSVYRTGTV